MSNLFIKSDQIIYLQQSLTPAESDSKATNLHKASTKYQLLILFTLFVKNLHLKLHWKIIFPQNNGFHYQTFCSFGLVLQYCFSFLPIMNWWHLSFFVASFHSRLTCFYKYLMYCIFTLIGMIVKQHISILIFFNYVWVSFYSLVVICICLKNLPSSYHKHKTPFD